MGAGFGAAIAGSLVAGQNLGGRRKGSSLGGPLDVPSKGAPAPLTPTSISSALKLLQSQPGDTVTTVNENRRTAFDFREEQVTALEKSIQSGFKRRGVPGQVDPRASGGRVASSTISTSGRKTGVFFGRPDIFALSNERLASRLGISGINKKGQAVFNDPARPGFKTTERKFIESAPQTRGNIISITPKQAANITSTVRRSTLLGR